MVGRDTCVTVHYLSVDCETAVEPEAGKFAGAVGSMGSMPVHDVYGIVFAFLATDEVCGYSGVGSIQSVGLVWDTVYFPRRRRVYFPMRAVVQPGRANRSLYDICLCRTVFTLAVSAALYICVPLFPECTVYCHDGGVQSC